jgi:hypothetical protein
MEKSLKTELDLTELKCGNGYSQEDGYQYPAAYRSGKELLRFDEENDCADFIEHYNKMIKYINDKAEQ